eukprot:8168066-Pyramimonas_sp.AAC.1
MDWTSVTPPSGLGAWAGSDIFLNGVQDGILGECSAQNPAVIFGDFSGSPGSKDPGLRRFGGGLVVVSAAKMN